MVWERDGKRAFQFEDGKLRVISSSHYDKIRDVTDDTQDKDTLWEALSHLMPLPESSPKAKAKAKKRANAIPFSDQIKIFQHLFPDGFKDEKWQSEHRGASGKRRVKRHRNAAIAQVQEQLSKEQMEAGATWPKIVEMLRATDLVTKGQLEPVASLTETPGRHMVAGVQDLLHGEARIEARLQRFIGIIQKMSGKPASWPVVTALLALYEPDKYIAVHPTSLRAQSASMMPNLRISSTPSATAYVQLQSIANKVKTNLENAELEPYDLLDVYDFIKITLKPASKKLLPKLKAPPVN